MAHGKESACAMQEIREDAGSIPGWGRSPGEGNGNPLQDSCLGNPVDGGARQAANRGAATEATQHAHSPSSHLTSEHVALLILFTVIKWTSIVVT